LFRTYQFPLSPSQAQENILKNWLEACCYLNNIALEQRIIAYKQFNKSVSFYDQTKDLTDLRSGDDYWYGIPAEILRSSLKRVDLGYEAFFRRVKLGQNPGFPRFKSTKRYDSLSVVEGKVSL
jgi:putative transposase